MMPLLGAKMAPTKFRGKYDTIKRFIRQLLGTCQIDEDNLYEWSLVECMGFGENISNVTLELKP